MSVVTEPAAGVPVVALEAFDLSHRYGPGRGLETVSFSVASPGAVAVTGSNGSGKSTLLRAVAGLLRPTGGRIQLTVEGTAIPAAGMRRRVGYAAPDVTFYQEFTVAENLTFAGEAMGLEDPRGAVRRALEQVGLGGRAGDLVTALSSGMVQRLRLAFALLHRPPLLLLDEPGSHMDEEGRALVARIVGQHRLSGLVLIATNEEREWKLAESRIELQGRGLGNPA